MVREVSIDDFDRAILRTLQQDGAMTNGALADVVHLSPSQCSRRRAALEERGVIAGYRAVLGDVALGFGVRAIIRINLRSHGQGSEDDFARFVASHPEIRSAFSVSGDCDYVLDVRVRDLAEFADFVHTRLLPQPQVTQVRSEIVLRSLKDGAGVPI